MDTGARGTSNVLRRWVAGGAAALALLAFVPSAAVAEAALPAGAVPPLIGTVVGEGGAAARALFGEGDAFSWVRVGQDVAPGVRLTDVQVDRVTLKEDRSGQEYQLLLGGSATATASAPRAAPPPRSPRVSAPSSGREILSMSPAELRRRAEEIKEEFDRERASAFGNRRSRRGRARSGDE